MPRRDILIVALFLWPFSLVAEEPGLVFEYAFLHAPAGQVSQGFFPMEQTTVTAGEKIQIVVKPETDFYLYVYLLDSDGGLLALFPPCGDLRVSAKAGTLVHVPAEDTMLVFDDAAGTETFHLLASVDRKRDLERLTWRYCRRQTANNKSELLDAILMVHRESSSLTTKPQKGEPSAATYRGVDGEDEPSVGLRPLFPVLVEEEDAYATTIQLEHR